MKTWHWIALAAAGVGGYWYMQRPDANGAPPLVTAEGAASGFFGKVNQMISNLGSTAGAVATTGTQIRGAVDGLSWLWEDGDDKTPSAGLKSAGIVTVDYQEKRSALQSRPEAYSATELLFQGYTAAPTFRA